MNKKMRNKKIGQMISDWRDYKSVTLKEMSQKTGINQKQLKNLEKGGDGLNSATFLQCLEGLGVGFNEFFGVNQAS